MAARAPHPGQIEVVLACLAGVVEVLDFISIKKDLIFDFFGVPGLLSVGYLSLNQPCELLAEYLAAVVREVDLEALFERFEDDPVDREAGSFEVSFLLVHLFELPGCFYPVRGGKVDRLCKIEGVGEPPVVGSGECYDHFSLFLVQFVNFYL